jgi:hypothetical protein
MLQPIPPPLLKGQSCGKKIGEISSQGFGLGPLTMKSN